MLICCPSRSSFYFFIFCRDIPYYSFLLTILVDHFVSLWVKLGLKVTCCTLDFLVTMKVEVKSRVVYLCRKYETSTDVLVCSRGGGGLLKERMQVVSELWAANIKVLRQILLAVICLSIFSMLWTISYWTTKYLTRNFQVFWLWETASWFPYPDWLGQYIRWWQNMFEY